MAGAGLGPSPSARAGWQNAARSPQGGPRWARRRQNEKEGTQLNTKKKKKKKKGGRGGKKKKRLAAGVHGSCASVNAKWIKNITIGLCKGKFQTHSCFVAV